MMGHTAKFGSEVPDPIAVIRSEIECLRTEIRRALQTCESNGPSSSSKSVVVDNRLQTNDEGVLLYEQQIIQTESRRFKAPQPSPRLIKRIIELRKLRKRFFDAELFADPAWDMILDLAVARIEYRQISVTSLCIASDVPPTTALRWIKSMVDAGIFTRSNDDRDRRRAYISLSDDAADKVADYFASCGHYAEHIV